jgi:hypothetical protein
MKIAIMVLFAVAFSFGGIFLQEHQIITHPAYWAVYGFIFGALSTVITLMVYDDHLENLLYKE